MLLRVPLLLHNFTKNQTLRTYRLTVLAVRHGQKGQESKQATTVTTNGFLFNSQYLVLDSSFMRIMTFPLAVRRVFGTVTDLCKGKARHDAKGYGILMVKATWETARGRGGAV
jgi:hypothetical protein